MYEAKDYEARIWWSPADVLYVAQCIDMPGIMAHGDTRAEAAASIHDALDLALACAREDHIEPPAPTRRDPVAA
jgi:predicted RNase H-like HicB family nuclease